MNILNVGYRSTNYYLIGLPDNRLLVDIGWPGTLAEFLAILKRKGVTLQTIKYALATHYHMDHAGLAQELKQKGVPLVVMESQALFISEMRKHMKPSDHYVEITLHDNLNLKFQASRAFLRRLGIQGEIIPTPGHSDDSVSLILDEGIAFTGDLAPIQMVPEDPANLARQSWERIRAKGVSTIYPAHGPQWRLA